MYKMLIGLIKDKSSNKIDGYLIFDIDNLSYMADVLADGCENVLPESDFTSYREKSMLDSIKKEYPDIDFITKDGDLLRLPVYVVDGDTITCVKNDNLVVVAEEPDKGYYIINTNLKLHQVGYAEFYSWYKKYIFYNGNPVTVNNKYLRTIPCRARKQSNTVSGFVEGWNKASSTMWDKAALLNIDNKTVYAKLKQCTDKIELLDKRVLFDYDFSILENRMVAKHYRDVNYLFNTDDMVQKRECSIPLCTVIPKLNTVITFNYNVDYSRTKFSPTKIHYVLRYGSLNCCGVTNTYKFSGYTFPCIVHAPLNMASHMRKWTLGIPYKDFSKARSELKDYGVSLEVYDEKI